jgi:parallel beta-helix repeat protein
MRKVVFKLVLVTVLCFGGRVLATDVGGIICTDTTWTLAGSPYIVTGSSGIVIGCNATLTIEPDVVVKFNPTLAIVVGSNAFGKGSLVARGTAESPIIFTSIKDPCNILDPARPGDWSRIHFTDYAVDAVFNPDGNYVSGCILEHVIIEYAGYGNYGAIFAEKSSLFLNYCEVQHNSYYGIQVDGSNAPGMKITDCEVWGHPQHGIYISGGSYHKLINNNIHDNRSGGISFSSAGSNTLTGNTITGNTSSDDARGGIGFDSSGSNTLTGNTIKDNTGGGIYFGSSGGNTLTGNTITDNTSSGYSGGIRFDSSGSNILTGNTITGNTGRGICFWCSPSNTLTRNNISGNIAGDSGGGIFFGGDWGSSGSNTLIENTITDNTSSGAGGGIHFAAAVNWNGCFPSGSNTFTRNTISGNIAGASGGGIYFGGYCGSGGNTLTGNTITDNTSAGAGGGIYFEGSGNTLTRNLVQGNMSKDGFGVVHLYASSDTVFSQNTITDNYIETGATGGIYVTDNSERVSLAGDPSTGIYNIICHNDGNQVYNNNTFNADGRNDINAVYVLWCTCDTDVIQSRIFDYFDDGSKAFVLFYPFVCAGDFDKDKDVDWLDLATFVDNWLRQDCTIPDWCQRTDIDLSTNVDFVDFAYFADNWLVGVGQ